MIYAGERLVRASARPFPAKCPHFAIASAVVALGMALFSSAAPAYDSASGARVRGLGVVSAPVDRRGPTLRPDPLMTPDSGWMSSGTAGVAGTGRSPGLPSLVPSPAQPVQVILSTPAPAKAKKSGKSRGRIILQKPNG